MKKLLFLIPCFALFSFPALAEEKEAKEVKEIEEAKIEKSNLRANFKRVALDISSVEVKNSEQYQDSPVSALNADSQTMIKGVLDFALEYEQEKYRWDNSIYLGYGKTTIKPVNEDKTKTENEDMILLASDYAYKMWKYDEADVGPFGNLAYQTEFTNNGDAPKTKIYRGKSGLKLFNGKYFSNLYVAGVGEYDVTYSDNKNTKYAWEVGTTAKFDLREGVDFEIEGYYRDYVSYSKYVGTDLKYDLNVTGRMNVKIVDKLALSPFVSYRYAQSREAKNAGSNFMIGLSLAYSELFNL